jgi:hypothetical protein
MGVRRVPIPLDEYPVHQTPLPMDRVATSDRNFYDRCYLNAHDSTGEIFLVTGLGVYPNRGVIDAYATVRRGDRQWSVRFSDALAERGLEQRVGGYRIEVVEPLRELTVSCAAPDGAIDFELHWTAAFPAVQEEPHLLLAAGRPILDASRFSQLGRWSGRLRAGDAEYAVTPDRWGGARDRSWGIRPVGEPEPPGRAAAEPPTGFWWLYAPLQFTSCAVTVILQEDPDGYRTVNDAKRVGKDGRLEQLGWPRADISYRPGTRHPQAARLHLTDPAGRPLTLDLETTTAIPLHVGAGYSGDPDWSHGRWMGKAWSQSSVYDLTDPQVAGRVPFGVIDHLARARLTSAAGTEAGWGLFEHASLGRHDPTGFADWAAVAP